MAARRSATSDRRLIAKIVGLMSGGWSSLASVSKDGIGVGEKCKVGEVEDIHTLVLS